jgi:hypothetical protein
LYRLIEVVEPFDSASRSGKDLPGVRPKRRTQIENGYCDLDERTEVSASDYSERDLCLKGNQAAEIGECARGVAGARENSAQLN